jgi:toxin ParE1/3/4
LALEIIFSPEAEAQLVALRRYIAGEAGLTVAQAFTDGIVQQCLSLHVFPSRGVPRDDLRAGLRTISFRGRVTIAYAIDQEALTILAVLYAGQDIDAILRER